MISRFLGAVNEAANWHAEGPSEERQVPRPNPGT